VRNLRSQLTLGVLVVLAVVLGIGGVLVTRDVEQSERQVIDDRLERTAELTRVTAVTIVQEGLPDTDRQLDDVLRATGSSLRLKVGGQIVVESGVPLPRTLVVPLGFSTRTIDGRPTRVYATSLKDPSLDGLARQEVASSLRQLEARQTRRQRKMLALGAVMLAVAALGVLLATGRVLRPLRRLRAATAGIAGDDDLRKGVPVAGPSELRGLAGSFNAMLARLGRTADERNKALAATRRFAADAGHELRTPLTSVQASLSIIARHPELDAARRTQLADDALAEQRRLVHLLDGLQALARGDAPVEHTDVDLVDVVDASLQAARSRHPGTTWEAELPDGPPGPAVRGWEPGLRILVDNLLENAARHGRPDGTVRVTVALADDAGAGAGAGAGGAGPTLTVEDDGPGIPPADRERIFEPFARAADTDRPGSGLGLALVAQQAGHHAARVTVGTSSALGGARFVVRYPTADSSFAANAAKSSGV
jgi:two-component system sensor histidine kinase PrrB